MYVPSSELGPPTPSAESECVSPLDPKGEQHSLGGWGGGGPNSDDCTESLALSIHSLRVGNKQIFRQRYTLKVHKRENFLGFDFEICTFS